MASSSSSFISRCGSIHRRQNKSITSASAGPDPPAVGHSQFTATILAPSSLHRRSQSQRLRRCQTPFLFPPNGQPKSSLPNLNSPISPDMKEWPKNEWFRKELFGLTGWLTYGLNFKQ